MILPPFKPAEYRAIVAKWVAEHRRPRRKMYALKANVRILGRWQEWPKGKKFIGYRARDGWHVIALCMRVRFPVTMCCVPNRSLRKLNLV